jgi:hypothetical protein
MSGANGQDLVTGGRKLCACCRQFLPLETFSPKALARSGLDSWCRPCRAENLRAWRAKRKCQDRVTGPGASNSASVMLMRRDNGDPIF